MQNLTPDPMAWFSKVRLFSLLQHKDFFASQMCLQGYTIQDKFAPKVITFQLPSLFLAQHKNSTAPLEGAAEHFSPGCNIYYFKNNLIFHLSKRGERRS